MKAVRMWDAQVYSWFIRSISEGCVEERKRKRVKGAAPVKGNVGKGG